jgi:hypothetical protein
MATTGGTGYEIVRTTGVCAATGRVIAVGEPYIAALVETEQDERLERRDYSMEAWQSGARPGRLFGFWKGTMESPEGKKRAYIDDAALLDLFEQLEGATEPSRISFRYLLTLMLMRKRLLKHEGTKRGAAGEASVMHVRQVTPAGATPAAIVEVIDPGMNDTAVAEAIEQLTAVMADGAGQR